MNKVSILSAKDREAIFRNTAQRCNINEAIIEKDFWVCWTLNYLFHVSAWKNNFAFKGGTSLSKAYNFINRFSEDIDLILDWRVLGYSSREPWKNRSKTEQNKFNKEINNKTATFLSNEFIPKLKHDFSKLLTENFELQIDSVDSQTVNFVYPQIFDNPSILKLIRLEIGALAAWSPAENITITSYAAEKYPNIFITPNTNILTVSAERTFGEKITILHKEAYRTNENFPERYSRHYYDLYCLCLYPVKNNAYLNKQLLKTVADFKTRFYPSNTARYDLAKPGTIKLPPTSNYVQVLEKDYRHMQNMIYGEKPEFSKILDCIKTLESEINNL